MWGWVWLESLCRDTMYALRQLRRAPGFSVTVIATLAFGIGAATAMFAVVDHVLLRPLPYPHPERLVTVEEASLRGARDIVAHGAPYLDLRAWQEQNKSFEQIAYYIVGGPSAGRFNYLEGNAGSARGTSHQCQPQLLSHAGGSSRIGPWLRGRCRAVQRWQECQYDDIE